MNHSICVRIVACVAGLVQFCSLPVTAAEKATKPAPRPTTATPAAAKPTYGTDVALNDGKLTGKLLTANGQPIDGSVVTVMKDGKEVGKAVTTSDGSYVIGDLKTGAHTVHTAHGEQQVRLWAKNVAPASAKTQLTLSQPAIRAQGAAGGGLLGGSGGGGLGGLGGGLGGASLGTVVAGGAAVGAGVFAGVQVNENEKLKDQIDALQSP